MLDTWTQNWPDYPGRWKGWSHGPRMVWPEMGSCPAVLCSSGKGEWGPWAPLLELRQESLLLSVDVHSLTPVVQDVFLQLAWFSVIGGGLPIANFRKDIMTTGTTETLGTVPIFVPAEQIMARAATRRSGDGIALGIAYIPLESKKQSFEDFYVH